MNKIVDIFVSSVLGEIGKIESKIILSVLAKEKNDVIEKLHMDKLNRQRVARIISIPENEWDLHGEVFNDFDLFSKYLSESNLQPIEQAELVFYFIRKNIACGLLEAEISAYDAPKMEEYNFKYIKPEEFKNIIQSGKFYELLNNECEYLSDYDKKVLEDIKGFIEANPLDISYIINNHRVIQECYFDKKPNLSKEDFKNILVALYKLKVSSSTVRNVRFYLTETCKIVNEEKENKKCPIVINNEPKKEILSKKDYYIMEQELKKYFDIDNMEAIKILTLEEEIYCIYLMKKMNYSNDIIEHVIKTIKKARTIGKINPIEHYLYLVEKLKYFKDINGMKSKIVELEKYFNIIFMIPDEENMIGPDEYDIYKEMMRLLLDEVQDMIPNNYEFEYKMADSYELKLTR